MSPFHTYSFFLYVLSIEMLPISVMRPLNLPAGDGEQRVQPCEGGGDHPQEGEEHAGQQFSVQPLDGREDKESRHSQV